jgi:hypothetical protein
MEMKQHEEHLQSIHERKKRKRQQKLPVIMKIGKIVKTNIKELHVNENVMKTEMY